ncbi:erythropoietin-like [Oncorhynchus mykiss]|uniref:erythropoietin-like n=1 Tax=Oncorhynchus mykiss TaxID=8022 RepID=UPI000B4FC8D5|nr:erythropoietin-like [Oncorhynchus mykiss]XP_035628764.1 erythropoietin-like isoform X2 [Oncorhynchus keta]XP_046173755.1 erythropoietin-like [Oncorhynchus gorbuscha]
MTSISGPVVVLLTVLQWAGRGLPSPVRPICDPRVLDRFIMEARDTETALRGCKAGCGVTGTFVVPLTNVDFVVWETKDTEEQALEVQSGMSLFGQALGAVRESVSRVAVQILIDNNKSNIHSLGQVLRSLHIQDLPLPPAPAVGDLVTRKVSSLSELLHVHTNFLRGKVRLLLTNAPACQQNST